VEETDTDATGNTRCASTDVDLDLRTDALASDRVDQLSSGAGCFHRRLPSAGIARPSCADAGKQPGLFELIVLGWLEGESDVIAGIHQSQVNHEIRSNTGHGDIDPVGAVGRDLPARLSHALGPRGVIADHVKDRLILRFEYEVAFGAGFEALDRGEGLVVR
jgi:hypothetical protein